MLSPFAQIESCGRLVRQGIRVQIIKTGLRHSIQRSRKVSSIFHKKVQFAEEIEEYERLPMLTGRQLAFMIFQHLKTNEVKGRSLDHNDLLNNELPTDNRKKFDQTWDESLMVTEEQPDAQLLDSLYHSAIG